MTWFKVDDGFYDHPKVKSLPRGAIRNGAISLWTLAGSWCGRYGKDGLIPAHQVEEFGATLKSAEALVAAELWHAPGHDCETCPDVPRAHYLYHEWPKYQPLKAEVEADKAKAKARMQRLRGKDVPAEPSTVVQAQFGRTNGERAGEQ